MMRNDYKRSLILLRSNAAGYSGHVRLERRTLMGTMYFMLQAPEDSGTLYAALVGRGRNDYYACPLGEFRRDSRGQATLSYSFDPRNICGRELEQYQMIAVANISGGSCNAVLYGNVGGHADLSWERVEQALCLSFNTGPERQEADEAVPQAAEEPVPEAAPLALEEAAPEEIVPGECGCAVETAAEPAPAMVPVQTAGEVLGIDMSMPWPDSVEPLRAMFAAQEELTDAPDNGYVYIAAPLPEGGGYSYLAAGLRAENGRPTAVCYAIPSAFAAEPPAGLEDYAWMGGNNAGWWTAEIDLATEKRI
ncbi:MAG: hypothetical protein IJ466_07905 [Clostridia bacterium]|nr:hypothetical protein [Clostridia bacterium]